MEAKRDVVLHLLNGLSYLERFEEPPDAIATQFAEWLGNVYVVLESAGMQSEFRAMQETELRFSGDYRLPVAMETVRALLTSFAGKYNAGVPSTELFSSEIVEGSREYIKRIAAQVNGCYEMGWYDACLVMLRRLIETLIVECFEAYDAAGTIQDSDGNFYRLSDLIDIYLAQPRWPISRTMRSKLPKLRELGNSSAHNRFFTANKNDVEKNSEDIRMVIQELVYVIQNGRETRF